MTTPELSPNVQTDEQRLLWDTVEEIQAEIAKRNLLKASSESLMSQADEMVELVEQTIVRPNEFKIDDADPSSLRLLGTIGLWTLANRKISACDATLDRLRKRWGSATFLLNGEPIVIRSRDKYNAPIRAFSGSGQSTELHGLYDWLSGRISGLRSWSDGDYTLRINPDRATKREQRTRRASYYVAQVINGDSGERLADIKFVN